MTSESEPALRLPSSYDPETLSAAIRSYLDSRIADMLDAMEGSLPSRPAPPTDADLDEWDDVVKVANQQAPQYELGELADLRTMPTVWWPNDGERRWMAFAWAVLQRAGEVTRRESSGARNHIGALVTLSALHLLRVSFYRHSHGEGADGVRSWPVRDLDAAHPFWIGVEIGEIFARTPFQGDAPADDPEAIAKELEFSWRHLTRKRYPRVVSVLVEELGAPELFASLCMSVRGESTFPVPDDDVAMFLRGGGLGPDADLVRAWSWIEDGMQPAAMEE